MKSMVRWGQQFEYEAKRLLQSRGYSVFRMAASHGLADLIAINKKEVLLIQCKRTSNPKKIFSAPRFELENFKVPKNVRKQLWIKRETKKNIEVIEC